MRQCLDAQSHCLPEEVAQKTTFYKVHWSDAQKQIEVMDQNGIEKSLLLYPTSDAHIQMGGWMNLCQSYNQGIAKIIESYPDRFAGAGIIPLDSPDDILKELKRIKDLGLKVISLASSYDGKYLDDSGFGLVFQFAQENRMPIHIHPQIINPIGEQRVKDPLLSPVLEYVFDVSMCLGKMMMEGIFTKFPDVDFIFAHYGGVLPFVKERFDNTYAMLRKRNYVKDLGKMPSQYFQNLYFDTSGSKSLASLLCMLEVVDAQHILWASDYPANQDIRSSIEFIDEISLTEEQKDLILGKNLLNLLSSK